MLNRHRRDEVRGYRALARTGVDPVQESHATRTEERTDAQRRSRKVARVLAKLPRRQRDVLLLFAVAELSYAEIAEATGLPLGSVQSTLHRARARMRRAQ